MDALGARVAAVPGKRAADLGTLRDPNQARSLGRKHWLSKQGVLAGSIGQASMESQPDSLVEQWTSQDRMGLRTSKRAVRTVPFSDKQDPTRVRVWIFSISDLFELSSENPAVCWYQDAVERSILVQVGDQCRTYRSASTWVGMILSKSNSMLVSSLARM